MFKKAEIRGNAQGQASWLISTNSLLRSYLLETSRFPWLNYAPLTNELYSPQAQTSTGLP